MGDNSQGSTLLKTGDSLLNQVSLALEKERLNSLKGRLKTLMQEYQGLAKKVTKAKEDAEQKKLEIVELIQAEGLSDDTIQKVLS